MINCAEWTQEIIPKLKNEWVCKVNNVNPEKWVKQTHPSTPSFVFMYWSTTQGSQQLINFGRVRDYVDLVSFQFFIIGPDHMVDFVRDNHVMQKFKEVALKRSLVSFSMPKMQQLKGNHQMTSIAYEIIAGRFF